jgi:hypothetical protein
MAHWLDKILLLLQADTSDLRELARLAESDPRTFYRGVDRRKLDLVGQDVEGMEFSGDAPSEPQSDETKDPEPAAVFGSLHLIRDATRAEERVAVAVRAILEDRTGGRKLLAMLSADRSKYANAALWELRSILNSPPSAKSLAPVKLIQLVRRHYTHAFPDSRAALLFYLAKHLSEFPEAKNYLRQSWEKSRSYAFLPYRDSIQRYLK